MTTVIVSVWLATDTGYHRFGKLKVDDQHPTTSEKAVFLVALITWLLYSFEYIALRGYFV